MDSSIRGTNQPSFSDHAYQPAAPKARDRAGCYRAAIDGFDGCFLGAGDMAPSMGSEHFGNPTPHPEVQRLIDRVRDETLAAGKLVMAPAGSGAAAHALIAQGVQLVVVRFGQFLRAACNTYLREARHG
jgi:2-keto-3-deoxy-L-rhamnonate aldolase RhmA